MAKIEHITDKNREIIYPFTREKAIYDDNGVNLPEKLATFVTRSVNDLINYYTKTETYTKAQVDELIRGIRGFSYEVVSELPSASVSTMWKFYLVPSADPQTQNAKDEFITIDNGVSADPRYTWEQIGSTAIDLSGYVTSQELTTALSAYTTTADLTTLLAGKQDAAVPKTWEQLKTLRDSSQLSPGTKYRITDYVATTIQTDTRSANHPFDIIVTAETASSLSEDASAAIHTGDTYFSGASANLAAWRVSYCLDNDTTRFSWADTTNGRGVIYRLVDEWDNDFPYDFKGIQFKRFYVTGVSSTYSAALSPLIGLPIAHSSTRGLTKGSDYEWYYTFAKLGNTWADEATDASFDGLLVQRNKITSSQYDASGVRTLNNVVFMGGKAFYDFIIAVDPNANIDGSYLYFDNIFDGESIINNTIIGFACLLRSSFAFRHNTIVGAIRHSHFGGNFSSNTLFITRDCSHVTYGIAFDSNVFRFSSFSYCSVSNYCKGNYIYCTGAMQVDSFGEYFGYNTFVGDSITFCRFGNGFIYNTFSNANLTTSRFDGQIDHCEFQGDFRSNSFGSILSYIVFVGGTSGTIFGAVDVLGSIRGTSSAKVRIENSAFIVDNVSSTRRRLSLEADADGKLVASWYDEGKRVGIMKAVGDADWTPLPEAYVKPASGIPETDLAQAVKDKLNSTEVFWATYGVTTIAEVRAAITAGKFVVVFYDSYVYVNNYYDSADSPGSDSYYFSCLAADEPIGYWLVLDSTGWSNDSFTLEDATHRVSSWQNSPDNQHYPSEKLVKDSIDAKYTKPAGGIPASDIASGVIPDVSQFITKSVNDLTNYYLKSETYTQAEVNTLIGAIQQFHYEIAASTSAVVNPQTNVLYLIGPTGSGSDKYEEYVYSSGWVKIGDTSIDLSGYVTTQTLNTTLSAYTTTNDLTTLLAGKQDTIDANHKLDYSLISNTPTIPSGALASKDSVTLSKGNGDQVLGESTTFTNSASAVSFSGGSTDTFVKSYPGETSKLATTTVPNVTSAGSASTWSFEMGTGANADTLIISGGNGTTPTLGTAKTVATGLLDTNGGGASVVTGLGTPTTASAVTGIGTATAAAQSLTVGTNDKVKVAKYDDLNVSVS